MKSKKLKSHNIYIEDSEWNRTKRLASKREVSTAQIVREAITFYLQRKGY